MTKGGHGREPQAAPQRESRGATARPPPCPPTPPHRTASHGGAGPHPPEAEGMIPPPPGETAAPEREAGPRPAPPAPAACSRRNHKEHANPRQRTRAPHGPRRETASKHEPERYGGYAPRDQRDGTRQGDPRPTGPPGRTVGRHGAQAAPPPHPTPRRRDAPGAQTHPVGSAQPQAG